MADLDQMNELADRTPVLSFRVEGNPPETYHLMINTTGLALGATGEIALRRVHRCTMYLHIEYPRRPPVVTWLTPILHPNILPPERNGGVCLGFWSASESLADLVTRLIDLVRYRSFNADDALDKSAAAWVKRRGVEPGVDLEALVRAEHATAAAIDDVVVCIAPRET